MKKRVSLVRLLQLSHSLSAGYRTRKPFWRWW